MERAACCWRCRRGMRELDVLLERYRARTLSVRLGDEQQAFAAFSTCRIPSCSTICFGHATPAEPELARTRRASSPPIALDVRRRAALQARRARCSRSLLPSRCASLAPAPAWRLLVGAARRGARLAAGALGWCSGGARGGPALRMGRGRAVVARRPERRPRQAALHRWPRRTLGPWLLLVWSTAPRHSRAGVMP